jgi:type I restriction enzyme S subunit
MRPYLRVANVYDARLELGDVMEMNFTPEEYETYHLKPGDVLLNEGQSLEWVGRAAIFQGEPKGACFQNTLVRFRAGPNVVPEFALLVFRHYLYSQRFRKIARWTTNIAHLGAERFAGLEFPLPPLAEQERIVASTDEQFTRLDAGVAALKRLQAHLRRYRATVLKAACEGRLVPTEAELARRAGCRYEPAEEIMQRAHVVQRSSRQRRWEPLPTLHALPEGWAWARAGDLAEIQGGIQKQPSRAPKKNAYPFLRVANVLRGRLDLQDVHQVELFDGELERLRLQAGDLLIIEGNGSASEIGRMAVWDGSIQDCVHQNHIIRLRPVAGLMSTYVAAFWNSPQGRDAVVSRASSTSGLFTLSVSKVGNLPVPVPPTAEQERISARVDDLLSKAEQAEREVAVGLRRSERLRASILSAAFRGSLLPPQATAASVARE